LCLQLLNEQQEALPRYSNIRISEEAGNQPINLLFLPTGTVLNVIAPALRRMSVLLARVPASFVF
jgi:hypothetical protein